MNFEFITNLDTDAYNKVDVAVEAIVMYSEDGSERNIEVQGWWYGTWCDFKDASPIVASQLEAAAEEEAPTYEEHMAYCENAVEEFYAEERRMRLDYIRTEGYE